MPHGPGTPHARIAYPLRAVADHVLVHYGRWRDTSDHAGRSCHLGVDGFVGVHSWADAWAKHADLGLSGTRLEGDPAWVDHSVDA